MEPTILVVHMSGEPGAGRMGRSMAQQVLDAGLFVRGRGWRLRRALRTILGEDDMGCWPIIAGAYVCGEVVGVALWGSNGNYFTAYVKPAYRRKGIGTAMVQRLMEHTPAHTSPPSAGTGVRGSAQFWRKCGITNVSPRARRGR